MGKETNVLESLEESSVSRRSFLKGTAALGIIYGGGLAQVPLMKKI